MHADAVTEEDDHMLLYSCKANENPTSIDASTPLAMLTVGQLLSILDHTHDSQSKDQSKEKKYVYGLRGIRELFHVSIRTAQIYKDTILKDAVYQNGRTIVVDADKAMKLFNERRVENG